MEQILKVENINVYYGAIHAIKGVSLHVDEGEVVTLIGANGAGKSTTCRRYRACSAPGRAPWSSAERTSQSCLRTR